MEAPPETFESTDTASNPGLNVANRPTPPALLHDASKQLSRHSSRRHPCEDGLLSRPPPPLAAPEIVLKPHASRRDFAPAVANRGAQPGKPARRLVAGASDELESEVAWLRFAEDLGCRVEG